ncbi:LegC family aminotransferase [Albibacterium sp.]|uniref:LegC family aminotransferase n=1 Tax=Albibacterium sp. TaxID=2952885 RepID=UPI002BAAB378|nr:LegC family aminotransferase [Albibacterium sp.]HUH18009.1 LegC family aminotransferase [Albibacterium sp.]
MSQFENVVSFIREQFSRPQGFIPLHEPRFGGNEKKYLLECVDSTFVSSVGKFVDQFEEMVSEYTGANKAVVCVNGTNALHLALRLVGVDSGDEVITQPLTFIATTNAISYCGAHSVFVDVDKDTLGLSPSKLEEWLLENVEVREHNGEFFSFNKLTGRRVSACVPMHTFGHPARIDEIIKVCSKHHIKVVEDAAESLGSFYKGKHTGTFSEVGVLSFNGNKTITTGGGGMLLFRDETLGEHAKHLTTQAKLPHKWEFRHDFIGYNYRMPNINAALGCAQMEQLPGFITQKRQLANKYKQFFSGSAIEFIDEPQNSESNFWLNAILLKNLEERNQFLEFTNANGVMTRPVWDLMNTLPMFNGCQVGDISNSVWLAERLVNIPSSVIE